jgi:hypothetical protein
MRRIRAISTLCGPLLILAALAVPASAGGGSDGVQFLKIVFDPPGNDTGSQDSLRKEVVVIVNRGSGPADLTGWTLRDRDRHIYTFPAFTLAGGAKVAIHTGGGADNAHNLFWDSDGYVWNNDGDGATLRRGNGSRVDKCSYSGSGSVASC